MVKIINHVNMKLSHHGVENVVGGSGESARRGRTKFTKVIQAFMEMDERSPCDFLRINQQSKLYGESKFKDDVHEEMLLEKDTLTEACFLEPVYFRKMEGCKKSPRR